MRSAVYGGDDKDSLARKKGSTVRSRGQLSDGVLIKENHIKTVGDIGEAVRKCRAAVPHTLKIEIEVTDLNQLKEALAAGADIILLDNMDVATMREAVRVNSGKALLEASGNITEENLELIASTGVDIISLGTLTHSTRALDMSLLIS